MENILRNKDKEVINVVWNFAKGKTKIISSTLKGESRERFGYVVSTNELLASDTIQSFLMSFGFPYIPHRASINKPLDYKEINLILLGGPRKNEVTKEIMQRRIASVYNFDTQFRLVNTGTRKIYESKLKDKTLVEYALVSKCKLSNSSNQGRTVVIIAGYRDLGTLTAAYFLIHPNVRKKIADKYGSNPFEFIIEIKYSTPQNPMDPFVSVIDSEKLEIQSLEIALKEAVTENPVVDLLRAEVMPEKIIYVPLTICTFILLFNSLLSFIFFPHLSIFLLPLFGSMIILFYLPLRTWKKYRTIVTNLTFALFGFCASIICFITTLGGIIIRLLLKI